MSHPAPLKHMLTTQANVAFGHDFWQTAGRLSRRTLLARVASIKPIGIGLGTLCGAQQSQAGAQIEEPLIVISACRVRITDNNHAPPVPTFADTESRLVYLRWLGAMSERLKKKKPDWDTRREFLQTVWYESKRAGLDVSVVDTRCPGWGSP